MNCSNNRYKEYIRLVILYSCQCLNIVNMVGTLSISLVLLATVALIEGHRFRLPQDDEAQIHQAAEEQTLERKQIHSACERFDVQEPLYRTANGGCNNLEHPQWGKAESTFIRQMNNAYDDGVNLPRMKGKNGDALPSPRNVSTSVHFYDPLIPLDNRWTVMFMQWGQFLDHDLTATPLDSSVTTSCCTADVLAGEEHPDVATGGTCFPIVVPDDDSYFNVSCLDFKRSLNAATTGNREQQNAITAFVDGSQVYGSSIEEQADLRSFVNGQLKVSEGENLPADTEEGGCLKVEDSDYCFKAGDHRVNVFAGLGALHTAFLRFHNQLATKFAEAKPEWTDEQIFQEAKKIVSAVLQHITYTEYLPEVLGLDGWQRYNLHDIDYHYNSSINPGIFQAFATAAFRFGHSTIVKNLMIGDTDYNTEDLFLRPHYVIHYLREIVQSLIAHPSELRDRFFVEAITNKLFLHEGFSTDLIALNINRGRDHGLPSYNAFRSTVCNLPPVTSFESRQFRNYGQLLASVYDDVDDVDLFTGGIAEMNVDGGTLGATFSCIIGKQFENLKFGDSFWYETKDSRRGFKPEQIAEIKKIFLSRVLCDTIHDFNRIQPFVMIPRRLTNNGAVPCSQIPDFNFDVFLNTEAGTQSGQARPEDGGGRNRFRLNNRPSRN